MHYSDDCANSSTSNSDQSFISGRFVQTASNAHCAQLDTGIEINAKETNPPGAACRFSGSKLAFDRQVREEPVFDALHG